MTMIDLKAKALELNFDKDDRGFEFFSSYVHAADNFFGWATPEVKAKALEMTQGRNE